ncbi:hypothetical protein HZS_1034 [Henneguya salminicola]|nr:hypothetical protein HZS_1034 [Henneguya salminicola]
MASSLGLKVNSSKCAILPMKKSLSQAGLPFRAITESSLPYKYLGIKEKKATSRNLSRETIQKSILASIKLIMNTSLSAKNKIRALKMFAILKLIFSLPFLIFPATACTELMKKITRTPADDKNLFKP